MDVDEQLEYRIPGTDVAIDQDAQTSRVRSANTISSVEPDWSRERLSRWWEPSRQLLRSIRRYQGATARRGPMAFMSRKWNVLMHRYWSAVTGADVPLNCRLGGGLVMPHPNGIVIHPEATIGPNCLIFQQVTVGIGGSGTEAPQIGGHVDIGAGAKVLGGVRIGDHAKIGANAVVLTDVPAGATAVGVPARVIAPKP